MPGDRAHGVDAFGDFTFPAISVSTGGRLWSGPITREDVMADPIVQLVDDEEIDLEVLRKDIIDSRGNRAKVQEGTERWVSSDEAIIAIVPKATDPENELACTARAVGPLTSDDQGNETLRNAALIADADLSEDQEGGAGVLLVTLARVQFAVVGGTAVGATVTIGEPRKQGLPPA